MCCQRPSTSTSKKIKKKTLQLPNLFSLTFSSNQTLLYRTRVYYSISKPKKKKKKKMKKPGFFAASVAAASATISASSPSSVCNTTQQDAELSKNQASSSHLRSSSTEKFAPRFDGLRFIETLVTAHR
ncbi:hypothetical protein ACB092_06G151100 [Castanea dentata]